MRQTKGAIGNLLNRYKAVLKKCNLLNTFGSLAVASMLVMGGAGVAQAEGTWSEGTWSAGTVIRGDPKTILGNTSGSVCYTTAPCQVGVVSQMS